MEREKRESDEERLGKCENMFTFDECGVYTGLFLLLLSFSYFFQLFYKFEIISKIKSGEK